MHYFSSSVWAFFARSIIFASCVSLCACSTGQGNSMKGINAITPAGGQMAISVETDQALPPNIYIYPPLQHVAMHPSVGRECVLLLHGLSRSGKSMYKMRKALGQKGYLAFTLDYPSTKYPIEQLSNSVLPAGIAACRGQGAARIHLVTHSMGGIIARHYLKHNIVPDFGRLVMLAPPNQGSELINFYRRVPGFKILLGPAANQLGTDSENSLPLKLGPVTVDTAIITGSESSNSLMSLTLPGADDGKVTAASTLVAGMCAQVLLPTSHRTIMKDDVSIDEVMNYIANGRFSSRKAVYFARGKSAMVTASFTR